MQKFSANLEELKRFLKAKESNSLYKQLTKQKANAYKTLTITLDLHQM